MLQNPNNLLDVCRGMLEEFVLKVGEAYILVGRPVFVAAPD